MIADKYQNLEPDLKKMIIVSLAFHAAIFLVFTVKTVFFPSDIPKYEPAIRVDLVGLPDKRNPDKPVVAPAPTPAPESVKEESKPEVKPTPPKEPEKKAATVPKKTSTTSQSAALSKLKSLSAIEKLKAMKDEKPTVETTKPQAETIKGNVLSVGSALKGLNKLEFDQYIGSLDAQVKNNWTLPEWMLTQGLKAEVTIKIDKTGQIIERKLTKKSGNSEFDERVMAAIEKSNPFPPPPEKFTDLVGIQGITFAFPE
jgi:colicin import membrane protein